MAGIREVQRIAGTLRPACVVLGGRRPRGALGTVRPSAIRFDKFNLKEYLSNIEHEIIKQALDKANGIVSYAAEYLNLRRTTLIEKIKRYNLVSAE